MFAWPHPIPSRSRRLLTLAVLLAMTACFADRDRPSPVEAPVVLRLSVQLLGPRSGLAVQGGDTVHVRVHARDLDGQGLLGVGFVARRFSAGLPRVDSAAVRFAARGDTTHDFTFLMPNLPTNSQIDIYGIAFGSGSAHRLSPPTYVLAVRCTIGICP